MRNLRHCVIPSWISSSGDGWGRFGDGPGGHFGNLALLRRRGGPVDLAALGDGGAKVLGDFAGEALSRAVHGGILRYAKCGAQITVGLV